MLFRRLAIALILTMAVALVGIACARGCYGDTRGDGGARR